MFHKMSINDSTSYIRFGSYVEEGLIMIISTGAYPSYKKNMPKNVFCSKNQCCFHAKTGNTQ